MVKYLAIGILALSLCGCAMDRGTLIAIRGNNITPTLGSAVPVKADDITMVIFTRTAFGEKTSTGKLDEIIKNIFENFDTVIKEAEEINVEPTPEEPKEEAPVAEAD